ncbi:MAG: Hsp20/alpha crystallin family protein [Brevundimonas sp.]
MPTEPQDRQPAPTSPIQAFSSQASHFFAPLQREIDRAFSDFGRGLEKLDIFAPVPNMDYAETADGIEITAELPGLTRDDVKITVEDDVLTLSGEKRAEKKDEGKDYRFVERRYGAFSRAIALPHGIDADSIKAEMKDGLLKVSARKPANGDSRKVNIAIK